MHDIHSAFVQKAIDKWNMTPILDSTPITPGIVAAGTCEWCSIFVAISSPPNKIAIESIFTEEPASIVVDLNANSLALYAMSPIAARYLVAKTIPWNDDEFWSLHGDYLKFVYEIDKRFGKKNIESNFVRDFKKAFDLLDASWQNIGANAPTQQLTLTTLLRLLFIANIADRGALDGRKSFLFEAAADDERNARSIYRSTIRPLFFDTLNKPHARRNAKAKRLGNIPFLNGGLFAPLQIEAASTKIDVPNSTILSILHSLFEPYSWNTSAAEDNSDPRDSIERRSHALDPWMLGHIFEMLMPASLRESSGSFYTPMPLAQAIVDRAFETGIGLQFHLDRDDIHALFHRKLSAIPNEQLDRIDKRLAQIRILDPAAGSGAFLQAAFDRLLALRSDIAVALSRPITRTQLAKYILTTNLYGIDILPAANSDYGSNSSDMRQKTANSSRSQTSNSTFHAAMHCSIWRNGNDTSESHQTPFRHTCHTSCANSKRHTAIKRSDCDSKSNDARLRSAMHVMQKSNNNTKLPSKNYLFRERIFLNPPQSQVPFKRSELPISNDNADISLNRAPIPCT